MSGAFSLREVPVRAVTFDCAGTLLDVRWDPGRLIIDCSERCGQFVDRERGGRTYGALLQSRWSEFQALNLERSAVKCDAFWADVAREWMVAMHLDLGQLPQILAIAEQTIYDPAGPLFRVFDDVVPTLEALAARGVPMAVLSNWDVSLHRMLQVHGLTPYFAFVVASLEEGIEKPDPRLFQLCSDRFDVEPGAILHVGDDPIDDLQGARGAGFQAVLLDRAHEQAHGTISSLRELCEWTG